MRTIAFLSASLYTLFGFMGAAVGCSDQTSCFTETMPASNNITMETPVMNMMTAATSSAFWMDPSIATVSQIAGQGVGGLGSRSVASVGAAAGEAGATAPGTLGLSTDGNTAASGDGTTTRVAGSVVTEEGGIPTISGVGNTAAQQIIEKMNLQKAGWTGKDARGGMLVSDNPQVVITAVKQAGEIMTAIESNYLLPKLNNVIEASGWKQLGVALASADPKDAQTALKNVLKTKKVTWHALDSKSSEFVLSVWLTCYALLAPEGSRFLPWAVARSIHKSNVFYEAVLMEMERTLKEKKLTHRKERIKLLKAVLYNPDVLYIRNWLARIGPMVVIEKENTNGDAPAQENTEAGG